jgi:dihydroorotate dehydrogenase (fumarate)
MMSQKVDCDLAASTGVHDGKAVIKQLLAGAQTVQVVSALYKNGKDHIGKMLEELKTWMTKHSYPTRLSYPPSHQVWVKLQRESISFNM